MQKQWVDQADALALLGKNKDYLEVLVRRKDVRSQIANGRREYYALDISQQKEAGLPNEEELAEELKQLREDQGTDAMQE